MYDEEEKQDNKLRRKWQEREEKEGIESETKNEAWKQIKTEEIENVKKEGKKNWEMNVKKTKSFSPEKIPTNKINIFLYLPIKRLNKFRPIIMTSN